MTAGSGDPGDLKQNPQAGVVVGKLDNNSQEEILRQVVRVNHEDGEPRQVIYRLKDSKKTYRTSINAWRRWTKDAFVKIFTLRGPEACAYRLLGVGGAIYPGHPLVIAYVIVRLYDTYADAMRTEPDQEYCNALANNSVPGAGGNVYSALRFLRMLQEGKSWEGAVDWAEDSWDRCDSQATGGYSHRDDWRPEIGGKPCTPAEYYMDRCQRGHEQADAIKPKLKEHAYWWSAFGFED